MSTRPNARVVSANSRSTSGLPGDVGACTAMARPPLAAISATTRSAPSLLDA
jgi:hypothetical protein